MKTKSVAARIDLYEQQAAICKVLTDPKRLMLLEALRGGDRSVGELAGELGVTLPNVSQHLAILRAAGLAESRRTGRTVRYSLAEPSILAACDIVTGIVIRRLAARPQQLRTPIATHIPR